MERDIKPAALIFGGSSGIGRKVIEALQFKNNSIINIDLRPSGCESNIEDMCGNLRDPGFIKQIALRIQSIPKVESILWTVRYRSSPGEDQSSILRACIDTELMPLVSIIEQIHNKIISDSPSVCLVSSIAATLVSDQSFGYNIVKAGQTALMRSLAVKYGDMCGARFNVIAPGVVDLSQGSVEVNERRDLLQRSSIPRCSPVTGKDLAQSILFLMSERSAAINGSNIIADGGESILDQYFVAQRTLKLAK